MVKHELVELSDEVWERTRARVEGLTDEEYLWEPAPGCWSIRQRADGTWMMDWPLPRPEPEPFTTIAWRLWHLVDMYGEDRAPRWMDVPRQGEAIGLDQPEGLPVRGRNASLVKGAIELKQHHRDPRAGDYGGVGLQSPRLELTKIQVPSNRVSELIHVAERSRCARSHRRVTNF